MTLRQTNHDAAQVMIPPDALAERWDTSRGRLANWRSLGIGPAFVKIGARVLYPLAAIEAFEHANTVTTSGALTA